VRALEELFTEHLASEVNVVVCRVGRINESDVMLPLRRSGGHRVNVHHSAAKTLALSQEQSMCARIASSTRHRDVEAALMELEPEHSRRSWDGQVNRCSTLRASYDCRCYVQSGKITGPQRSDGARREYRSRGDDPSLKRFADDVREVQPDTSADCTSMARRRADGTSSRVRDQGSSPYH